MQKLSELFSKKQIEIIELLMDKSYIQKDLQKKLRISSPGLLYHLNILEQNNFIQKNTIHKVGNAKINEISIDPIQLQNIRQLFNKSIDKCTLITGFGELIDGYRIPDNSIKLLHNKHFIIDKLVCITTRKAKRIRESKKKSEDLHFVDKYYADYDYNDFRSLETKFFNEIDIILREELKLSDLVVDITPLSKLYSFEMLKRANKYKLACYYIGTDKNDNKIIIWMTNVKISGKFKT